MWQLVNGFILCWGLFVIVIGMINLWVSRYSAYNDLLITRLAVTNLFGLIASIVISFLFFSYPVIIFSGLIALLYFASAISPTTRI